MTQRLVSGAVVEWSVEKLIGKSGSSSVDISRKKEGSIGGRNRRILVTGVELRRMQALTMGFSSIPRRHSGT